MKLSHSAFADLSQRLRFVVSISHNFAWPSLLHGWVAVQQRSYRVRVTEIFFPIVIDGPEHCPIEGGVTARLSQLIRCRRVGFTGNDVPHRVLDDRGNRIAVQIAD